ncbi:MAG: hypothetical protein LBD21_07645 [Tannerellaceae bacterium]|jgi:hypothetical protein|nr:hypothetical protein [Tannerellaceae bacterium]
MAANPDWLPRNHQQLRDQLTFMWAYLSQPEVLFRLGFLNHEMPSAPPGTLIPPNFYSPTGKWLTENFNPRFTAYLEAYEAWQVPAKRSPEVNLVLKRTEKDVKDFVRQLYIYIKGHPLATPADRLEMGFPVQEDSVATPAHVPASWPVAQVSVVGVGVLLFHYVDSKTKRRGKPAGVHGAMLRWIVSDTPPEHFDQLINNAFATVQPIYLNFDISMQGKTLYYATCWVNNTGKAGPLSAIAKVIIS